MAGRIRSTGTPRLDSTRLDSTRLDSIRLESSRVKLGLTRRIATRRGGRAFYLDRPADRRDRKTAGQPTDSLSVVFPIGRLRSLEGNRFDEQPWMC